MNRIDVFYARVSTLKEEQDSSIENQERYFNDKGIKIGYVDRGSGTSIEKRAQFQQLLKDCGLDIKSVKGATKNKLVVVDSNRESKIRYIYTKSISRFARNVRDTLEISELLKKKNTYIIFEDLNRSTEDSDFFVTMSIMAVMSENESREKSRSIKMGNNMSAKSGIVRSVSAYGYRYNKEDNTLTAIEEEAEVVRKIFELKVNNGFGGRKIAQELNRLGYKAKKGGEWKAHVINRIVKNPIYYGATVRNRYNTNKLFGENNHKLKSEDEWVITMNNKVEAIISEEMFNKAQQVRKKYTTEDKQGGVWVGRGELSQKIVCEKCGEYYTRNRDIKKRSYGEYVRVFYNCSTKKRYGVSKCNSRNVSSEEVEEVLNKYLKCGNYKKIANGVLDTVFKQYADNYIVKLKESINTDNKDKIKQNEAEIFKLKAKLSRLLDMYLDDGIAEDVYKEKEQSLKTQINYIEKENVRLSESENKIMDRINTIINAKKDAMELVNKIEDDISREDFIENYLLYIEVKENDKLNIVTKMHLLAIELISNVEGVKNGSSENIKFGWGDT